MKKLTITSLAAAMIISAGCVGQAQQAVQQNTSAASTVNVSDKQNASSEVKQVENTYILNEENVKLCGRTYLSSDNVLWCSLSGTGAEFKFSGRKLDVTLVGDGTAGIKDNESNYARYAVYVDGARITDGYMNEAERTFNIIDSDKGSEHTVKIIKISECAMSNLGIKPLACDGTISPAEPKKLKIEFIGDSITCGYGVDDENAAHQFKTITEDCTKAYAYKTADALDADRSLFSVSGWGIISGYTNEDKPSDAQRIPRFYEKLGFSYSMIKDDFEEFTPQSVDWDFSRYTPDLIVINLGTNDDSYCKGIEDRCLDYAENYTKFLTTIHKNNPKAKILCCLGLMGDRLYPYVEKAAEDFKEQSGWDEIYTLKLSLQDSSKNGYAADYHPTAASHDKAAEEVTAKIKEILGL